MWWGLSASVQAESKYLYDKIIILVPQRRKKVVSKRDCVEK